MITTIREVAGGSGFDVIVSTVEGPHDQRTAKDLTEAFAMQKAVQETGKWPDGKDPLNGKKH